MKNKLALFSLSSLVVIATGCTPLPYKSSQRQASPRYRQSSVQQSYRPPAQPQYSPSTQYAPTIQTRNNIVKLAYQQIGIRYRYGGSNPREGFDCSGLTHYLYQNGAGIKIPRTSVQQRNKSRTVQYANLQPGDLLFFKTGAKTNHVGIYIGHHQFIHAPNQRSKVKITTMDNTYWQRKFVKFGTFLKS